MGHKQGVETGDQASLEAIKADPEASTNGRGNSVRTPRWPGPQLDVRIRSIKATTGVPLAISGWLNLVVEADAPPAILSIHGSLVAGGYLGSMATRPQPDAPPPWPNALSLDTSPVTVEEACDLAWGLFAYSTSRGTIDSDEYDGGPAMGLLPTPPGPPNTWLARFMARFDPALLSLADAVAEETAALASPPAQRCDVPVEVGFRCGLPTQTNLRDLLEHYPGEFCFRYELMGYEWNARRAAKGKYTEEVREPNEEPEGLLWIEDDSFFVKTARAEHAAGLATRLEGLLGSELRLFECTWIGPSWLQREPVYESVATTRPHQGR